jgi:ribosomal protein S21
MQVNRSRCIGSCPSKREPLSFQKRIELIRPNLGTASAVKTHSMGIRIVVRENEPIGLALKKLKKRIERNGVLYEMRRHVSHIKASQIRRAKKFNKRFQDRWETLVNKKSGIQTVNPASDPQAEFWRRTGKP